MGNNMVTRSLTLFGDKISYDVKHPSTRYQGSKLKLVDWIWDKINHLEFDTFLDAFSGTSSMAFQAKKKGKQVYVNDILKFNFQVGKAIIENKNIKLNQDDIEFITKKQSNIDYPSFIEDTFEEIYFTQDENRWLDYIISNIRKIDNEYKQAIAYSALGQAGIIKRPFNLFHRKNLYVRTADVDRNFGNKTTWDTPFTTHFKNFMTEYNNAIFDNNRNNKAFNLDAFDIPNEDEYDLVYIDTPYISSKKIAVDYYHFYHFLEGMLDYDNWKENIDMKSKHRRLIHVKNPWTNHIHIASAFERLIKKFQNSIIVISYRSDGIPSIENLHNILEKHGKKVEIHSKDYKYVLRKPTESNKKNGEVLLIAR